MSSRIAGLGGIQTLMKVDNDGNAPLVDLVPRSCLSSGSWSLSAFQTEFWLGLILAVSGVFHFGVMWITHAEWSGPLSPRKPALFGISGGLTVWSLAWVITKLRRKRADWGLSMLIAVGLFFEVALITLQYWRGVPSHFNRSTTFDASVEAMMFILIMLVTIGIGCLCCRSIGPMDVPTVLAVAIRGGLWLLLVSCGLGFLMTILGEFNLAQGKSYETWGVAGVIKYPHGAALHAIQVLPLCYLLFKWFDVPQSTRLMWSVVAAHMFFMVHALWQTFHGRARLDVDFVGGLNLAAAVLCLALPFLTIGWSAIFSRISSR